jgi:polyferredoxin
MALWIARRLYRGRGVAAAYWFLSCLTGLVLIGAIIVYAANHPAPPPFPGIRILSTARIISGLFLVFTWIVLIVDSIAARRVPER